ncbi:Os04g0570850, partial [Oryza sativa Japonica Group]
MKEHRSSPAHHVPVQIEPVPRESHVARRTWPGCCVTASMRPSSLPATSGRGGADGSIVEGDDLADVVDVRAGAVGEHGAAAGEPELFAFDADPVLHRLLDGELLVRHVGEPRDVAAGRPRERVAVPLGRRHEAPEPLALRRAVPLPVHEPVPREPQRALDVLARRVLGVLGRARLVRAVHLARRHLHPLRGMVRREVERRGRRGVAAAAA